MSLSSSSWLKYEEEYSKVWHFLACRRFFNDNSLTATSRKRDGERAENFSCFFSTIYSYICRAIQEHDSRHLFATILSTLLISEVCIGRELPSSPGLEYTVRIRQQRSKTSPPTQRSVLGMTQKYIWWRGYSFGALGVDYLFIAINPRSTLIWNDSTS